MIAFQRFLLVLLVAMVASAVSCSDAETKAPPAKSTPTATQPTTPAPAPTTTPTPPSAQTPKVDEPAAGDSAALAARGSAVYTANCIACHNTDPAIDGAIGPAIAGSSFELLEARVMRNEYPEGYKPKRETKAMIALPYLERDLAALTAFLAK